jgi:catechol 2,3-dioxygenase-like lactoylglutathione lyase family enzyme
MTTVSGLSHMVISVNDLDKMVAFYRDVMGLTITHQHPGHMVFLTSDPTVEDHEIGLFTGREGDSNVLVHHCWRVPTVADVKSFYQRFKELGVPIDECVSYAYPWGAESTVSCYFRDPEGNQVEIQAMVPLDPEIPDRTTCLLDFDQSEEEITGRAQRRIPAPMLTFGRR